MNHTCLATLFYSNESYILIPRVTDYSWSHRGKLLLHTCANHSWTAEVRGGHMVSQREGACSRRLCHCPGTCVSVSSHLQCLLFTNF